MTIGTAELWTVIICMGLGSFGLRYLFLGVVGNRQLPDWLLRHLRYTAVAVLPALVAPLALWPNATGGTVDPLRLSAAVATFVVAFLTKNVLAAIGTGAAVLIGVGYWT